MPEENNFNSVVCAQARFPPAPGWIGKERRGNLLHEEGFFWISGAPLMLLRCAGGWHAQGWLTRTLACLCASASTANECCSPAGRRTSLLKEKVGG